VLGDTFSAECLIPGLGEAELRMYVLTSDGSLRWDIGTESTEGVTTEGRSVSSNKPMGTILAPTLIAGATATVGGAQTCHAPLMTFASG
jgi:hypothetical protein